MDNPEEAARVREIKRLLDRIQQLPLVPEGSDHPGVLRPGANASQQQRFIPGGHTDEYLGGRRGSGRNATLSPWLFVLATALNTIVVAVLAVLITLGVVRQGAQQEAPQARGPKASPRAADYAAAAPPPGHPTQIMSLTRVMELQPIGSPDRPLRLQALRPARLPLQIQPDEAQQETFILVLSGLPPKTSLSGAERISSDSWLLAPGSIGKLGITVPEWSASPIEVGIELRRTTGEIAARSKAWIALSAPQHSPEAGTRIDQAALKEVTLRGDQLLNRGDVVAARALYLRAAEMGSGPAALALGTTFDPNRLWSLGVFGMVGNKERAQQWYARADQLGHPEAKARLKALGN